MHIKKGDNVIVITGKDKGKTGKIEKAYPKDNTVVIAGVNIKKVHERARREGAKGQVVEKALPFNASNVMVVDPKSGKRTRIGKKDVGGKNVRVAKKSGMTLDK